LCVLFANPYPRVFEDAVVSILFFALLPSILVFSSAVVRLMWLCHSWLYCVIFSVPAAGRCAGVSAWWRFFLFPLRHCANKVWLLSFEPRL